MLGKQLDTMSASAGQSCRAPDPLVRARRPRPLSALRLTPHRERGQALVAAHEAPDLDPAANLYLGREIKRKGMLGALGMLDKAEMRRRASEEFGRLGVTLQSVDVPIGSLSGGQRQSVAVARSVVWASKVVFMDEPTAALGVVQRERVLDVIRKVRDAGIGVVLISHNMPEVLSVSDRVEVLRLGKRVARFTASEATLTDLVGAMTGALVQEDVA